METTQKQLALFLKSPIRESSERIVLRIREKLGATKTVQHIPVPSGAPEDWPRVSIAFDNFNINVAGNRIDLFFTADGVDSKKIIDAIFDCIVEPDGILVNRVGFVHTRFVVEKIDTLKNLFNQSCKPEAAKELAIRVGLETDLQGYLCNNIESLNYVTITKVDIEKPIPVTQTGILIGRDINTVPEKVDEYVFDKNELLKFFEALNTATDSFIMYAAKD